MVKSYHTHFRIWPTVPNFLRNLSEMLHEFVSTVFNRGRLLLSLGSPTTSSTCAHPTGLQHPAGQVHSSFSGISGARPICQMQNSVSRLRALFWRLHASKALSITDFGTVVKSPNFSILECLYLCDSLHHKDQMRIYKGLRTASNVH